MPNFYVTTTHSVCRNTMFTKPVKSTFTRLGFIIDIVEQPKDYMNILCLGIIYKDEQGRDISLFRCWDEDPTKYVEYYGIQGMELYEDLIV